MTLLLLQLLQMLLRWQRWHKSWRFKLLQVLEAIFGFENLCDVFQSCRSQCCRGAGMIITEHVQTVQDHGRLHSNDEMRTSEQRWTGWVNTLTHNCLVNELLRRGKNCQVFSNSWEIFFGLFGWTTLGWVRYLKVCRSIFVLLSRCPFQTDTEGRKGGVSEFELRRIREFPHFSPSLRLFYVIQANKAHMHGTVWCVFCVAQFRFQCTDVTPLTWPSTTRWVSIKRF